MKIKHMVRSAVVSATVGLLALVGSSGAAANYSAVVVYGDSLSDNGNFYAATGFPPSPPYYQGRRSDGLLAVEYMANRMGLPLLDLALIGATTGVGNYADGGTVTSLGAYGFPGMGTVFANTGSLRAPYLSDGLFVVWGGPNDVLAPSTTDTTAAMIIERGVSNLISMVGQLQAEGAHTILVPGMPDLGLTPSFQSLGALAAAEASAFSDAFNALLQAGLPAGVMYYDTAAFLREVVQDPQAYGLSNVSDPCFNSDYYLNGLTLTTPYAICSNPQDYLFFDSFHPSTAANALLASEFMARVPEPGSFSLLVLSLFLMGVALRRPQRIH